MRITLREPTSKPALTFDFGQKAESLLTLSKKRAAHSKGDGSAVFRSVRSREVRAA